MKTWKSAAIGLVMMSAFLQPQQANAVTSPEIIASCLNYACVNWRIDGICIWITCTIFGCYPSTSMKVSHFNPEVVVSSYGHTGFNPWREVSFYSPSMPATADGMGYMTDQRKKRNQLPVFMNADVIGHPGSLGDMGFSMLCSRTTQAFQPYFLSTLDYYAWRWGFTEQIYPASYIPGMRELTNYIGDNWGNIFPRQGFLIQAHHIKAAAVMAQRAADITSNIGSPHVYVTTQGASRQGYWPPGPIIETDPLNHLWQGLHPIVEPACYVWPTPGAIPTNTEEQRGYAWALWRPYACCQQAGQRLIFYTPHPYH